MISNSTLSPTIVGSIRKLGQNSLPSRLNARISYLTLIPTITKVRKNPLKIYYTDKKTPNLCFILSKIGLVGDGSYFHQTKISYFHTLLNKNLSRKIESQKPKSAF